MNTEKKTILIADDEPSILDALYEALSEDYEVILAGNGREAFDFFVANQSRIKAVITDLVMPELYGDKLIEQIHAIDADMPVILMTGFEKEVDVPSLVKRLGGMFVKKPFDIFEFAKLVRGLTADAS
ncbi:MAG: response regulator [Rhizobacter sp.]|nr:response regulator [Chlorobiales bacterium]